MRGLVLALGVVMVAVTASAASLSVRLDYLANANHVPLYFGIESGEFTARSLDVDLLVPTDASDPVRYAAERRVDLALTPQINYLMARAEGIPVIAVGVLIDRSLGGLLALGDQGIASLADLAGRPVGYSLAPLEPALWRTMLASAGIPSDEIDLVNVGLSARSALLTGTVGAIGAFRNVELVLPEIAARQPVFFAQEDYGVPKTYELVFVANSDLASERRAEIAAFLDGVTASVRATREAPQDALGALFHAYPELDDEADRLAFAATLPLYADDARSTDPAVWVEMERFLAASRLIAGELPYESLVDPDLMSTRP